MVNKTLPRLTALILPLLISVVPLCGSAGTAPVRWEAAFSAGNGLALRYDGIPVIRKSTLYLVRPGWTGILYNQELVGQSVERETGPHGPALTVTGENENFRAVYRLEAVDENTFRIEFEGELRRDIPAQIEYAAGYFNANLIAGRPFRAEGRDGETRGTVASFPDTIDQLANDLVPYFRTLEFDSRIGGLRVEANAEGRRVLFFDARRDPQGWARHAPVFWSGLGVPARPIEYGKPVRLDMVISVDPSDRERAPAGKEIGVSPVATAGAQSSRDRPIQLIPQPKSVEWKEGVEFHLPDGLQWLIYEELEDFEVDEALQDAVARIADDLRIEARGDTFMARAGTQVHFFEPGKSIEPRPLPDSGEERVWVENPEGYRLSVDANGIVIESPTQRGAFYGLQTLRQLLRPAEGGFRAPGVVIEDWPTFEFRGAHWFPSASGVPFHRKLTERIFGAFKLNHSVIQCEAARWNSHPEIAAPNSIETDDLQGLVDLTRENFMEPIPLINVPGHAEWIFRNGQNMDIVEDPEVPYAYCVRHPRSDAFITDILAEAMTIFRPRAVHAGHDEVTMRGQFPHPDCPRCGGESVTTLFLEHVNRIAAFLGERRVDVLIWGDMLLAREEIPDTAGFAPNVEEARARREGLPEGIVIADWHYDQGSEYPSIGIFQDLGHRVIGSTWHRPLNIFHFTRALIEAGSLGLLQTTWAGYFPDESVLDDALHQFSAFILAAEYSWSGRAEPPASLGYDPGTVFLQAYHRTGEEERDGFLVDLSEAASVPRAAALELHEGWDLAGLPSGAGRFGDVIFDVPEENLPVIGGRFAPESSWRELRLSTPGVRANEIVLLNAALFGAPAGTVAGRIAVEFDDGETLEDAMVIGRNTAYWGNDAPVIEAPVGWQALTPAGTAIGLRVTRWINPRPENEIVSVRLKSGDPEQAWLVAGVTFLECPRPDPGGR